MVWGETARFSSPHQVEQTLDAEYYWLSRFLRHALQKRRAQGVVVRAGDTNHEELKAVALIEREEMQQVRSGGSRGPGAVLLQKL